MLAVPDSSRNRRRDAGAILFLVGLITFFATPFLLRGSCEWSLLHLGFVIGPALLVAPIAVRTARASVALGAAALFIVLFLVEIVIGFFASLDQCPLILGSVDAVKA